MRRRPAYKLEDIIWFALMLIFCGLLPSMGFAMIMQGLTIAGCVVVVVGALLMGLIGSDMWPRKRGW